MGKFSGLFDEEKEQPKVENKFQGLFDDERTQDTQKEKAAKPSFDEWYAGVAKKTGLNPNPDDPRHFYDYRAAYEAGVQGPDETGHWPSEFKKEGHPRMVVDGINTKTGEPVKPEMGAREIAKGVGGGLLELPAFPARVAGELITSLADPETRFAVKPADVKYSMVPGMVFPTIDEYHAAQFKDSQLNIEYQKGITDMKNAVLDFAVDLVPSLIDKDWKPHVETVSEKRGQEMVESYSMLPVQVMAFIPQIVGEAVTDATGDKFLGKSAELAAFGGVVKGMKTRGEARAAQQADHLRRQIMDHEPEGWLITEETKAEVVMRSEDGKEVKVKKSASDDRSKLNRKKKRATKNAENQAKISKASEALRSEATDAQLAIEAMDNLIEALTPKEEVVPTPEPKVEQPKPPPRRTKGGPRKGMASGQYRFNRGKLFDPEGHLIAKGLSTKEGKLMVDKMNKSEAFTGKAENERNARFDRAIVDRKANFDESIQDMTNQGISYEGMIKRLREVYYNMSKEDQLNHKMRYNTLLGKLSELEKQTRRPIKPVSKEVTTKAHKGRENVRAAEIRPPTQELEQKMLPKERRKGKPRTSRSEFPERLVPDLQTLESDLAITQESLKYRKADLEKMRAKSQGPKTMREVISLESSIKDLEESVKLYEQRRVELETGKSIIKEPTVLPEWLPKEESALERNFREAREKRGAVPRSKPKEPAGRKSDIDIQELHNATFGTGHVVRHTTVRTGGNDLIPYPSDLSEVRSALIDNDGNMIVGKGSADAHRMLMKEVPEDMRPFYEKNRQTHQGWADEHDRFISIGDVGKAKGEVADAFRNRYGELKPTGKAALKTVPEEPAAFTAEQSSSYLDSLDFTPKAEWNMVKDVHGFKVHIKKVKGKTNVELKVDGLPIKGSKPKGVVKAILRGLDNDRGQAYILNHAAKKVSDGFKFVGATLDLIEDVIKKRFAPAYRTRASLETAATIRHINSKMDIANERLAGALKATRRQMARWSQQQSIEFIDNMERGRHDAQVTPELQKLSRDLRKALDANWEVVVRLGGQDHVIENYFPRYWDVKPGIIARIKARRGITGPKGFQKTRRHQYFTDGLNAGLTPLSWNPIDHFLWKMQETNKFIAGQTIWNELRASGHVRFVKSGSDIPHGYVELNDPIARVTQFLPREKAFIQRGAFYAPDPVATVFNNYLEPGFYGTDSLSYRFLRYGNNAMNMAQLGLSAFHFMFTALDSIGSSVTNGVELMLGGHPIKGAAKVATGILPTRPFTAFWEGRRLRKALYSIDPVNAMEIEFITRLEEAGGGAHLEKYYDLGAIKRMQDAFGQGKYITGTSKLPAAAIEYSSRWIMSHWVPNLKLAMAFDQFMMQNKIWEHKGIEPTLMNRRVAYGKQWDSIDNRMGQLRYDNLFINRKLKDSGMVFYRALGWNIGSIREFAGGFLDIPKSARAIIKRVTAGEKPNFAEGDGYLSRRTLYTGILLGVVIPAYTLSLEWALTGRNIRDIVSDDDWHPWYAKTGKIKPNGEPERVSLASYAKDITSYGRDFPRGLVSTTGHKISPLLHYGFGLLENRRFNGEIVYDWDKTWLENAPGVASYTFEHFMPFSFRNIQMRRESGGRYYSGLENIYNVSAEDVRTFFGVVPAPAYAPQGPFSHEEIRKRKLKGEYIAGHQTGNQAMMDAVIESGEFTAAQLRDAIKRSKTPSTTLWIMALPMPEVMKVIPLMTRDELKENKYVIYKKFMNNRSTPKDKLDEMWKRYEQIRIQKEGK